MRRGRNTEAYFEASAAVGYGMDAVIGTVTVLGSCRSTNVEQNDCALCDSRRKLLHRAGGRRKKREPRVYDS